LKLSIITINLNNLAGLKKTFDSVISQTDNDFEYLIIDGGSTDGSYEFIEKNSEKINYWVSESDHGIYHAMNKGIKQASGEYCFFLNSGDYLVNDQVIKKVFRQNLGEDIIFGNLLVFFDGKFKGKSNGKPTLTFLDVYSSIPKHQSSFIKRELFHRFGFYNEDLKIVADWEFFLKTIGFGEVSYKYLELDISCFDNDGISNNSGNLTIDERNSVIDRYVPAMMRPDYEVMMNYGKYEVLTKNRITMFFLRLMTKCLSVLQSMSKRK
jgi:glycosyltransferase involved in cell wall biosynthesis